ncbi:glutamate racemase [Shewanella sp. JM162201]|uniref:Glutamate racemase n=1 Tax=Shewanella jiangmenensis TaxID=2837387 RepID=A0ABS5V6J1_9GAMM|nr:glutamate racemase [Shewanella jiangmenensis]MBT1446067.1 glutamate racemase [Shewanella jiangmenensis]
MSRPILVFDSGIGGLSVLSEIRKLLPDNDYCYLFDNARLPYGELAEDVLVEGCVALVKAAASKIDAALVVIACNTASTLVLPALRAVLSIPVVGVVPAIKPAAAQTQTGHIGLLATPGTVRRSYTHELVERFASHCKVHMFGSSELVAMAEQKMAGIELDMQRMQDILQPIRDSHIDALVLGCTHFPLLGAELQLILGEKVALIDSGEAIANRVVHLIANEGISDRTQPGSLQTGEAQIKMRAWYTTPSILPGLMLSLERYGFTQVSRFSA